MRVPFSIGGIAANFGQIYSDHTTQYDYSRNPIRGITKETANVKPRPSVSGGKGIRMDKKETPSIITENGRQYFLFGRNCIEVSEHFAPNGKTLEELLVDVITYIEKQRD